ncbi:MAG: DUF4147 domain-containing protein [Patescibacteria group bacterium]
MHYIKNYDSLATNENRKIVLSMIEAAYAAIQPREVLQKYFTLKDKKLTILKKHFDLSTFERVFVIGFGKGSALMCKIIEEKLAPIESELGEKFKGGFVIDVVDQKFKKLHYTVGTHPLPSQKNLDFTTNVIKNLAGLTEKDLVIITTCGGGSVLFEAPHKLTLDGIIGVNKALLKSGATISEMNAIRKHLSKVKGGGLAKILYPATVVNLLFSDVPGNDLSVIASGPLVKDHTTIEEATAIYKKYELAEYKAFSPDDFVETPKEAKYFEHVSNILMLSNLTALDAMEKKARSFGYNAYIFDDRLQGDAHEIGKKLIHETQQGEILLAGGETTVKVKGTGKGGRNQTVVLSTLSEISGNTVIASFGTDGWDFYGFAGAIGDKDTQKKITDKQLDVGEFLDNDNSYEFWKETGDGIDTGKLDSNVADLFIVFKK